VTSSSKNSNKTTISIAREKQLGQEVVKELENVVDKHMRYL